MKCPLSWLKELVPFEDTVEGLADQLTFSGVEVEGIETIGSDFTNMVVGEIRVVSRHPNADRLTCCTVFDGTEEYPVVCGAPNVREGMKSAFARTGAVLPGGFKLKKAKIRGEVSKGMLCAEDELGLSEEHEGIVELADHWPAGTPLSEVYGPPETVLDLEITPNRPDCLSMLGLAREVAALYGSSVRRPETTLKEEGDEEVSTHIEVSLDDPVGCPRYTARIIRGIRQAPSPDWMQQRLTHCGIRPINNVVDITNYVMLECGQPLHAFDLHLLEHARIVVRRPAEAETLSTLDGIERPLTPDTLLIADGERPVALAGVMGGAGSEIRDETTEVLLESACFDPDDIRRTSRRLGLSTDSSYRFERGVDIEAVEMSSRRAAALLEQLAGGRVSRGVVDAYPAPRTARTVCCRWNKLNRLLGYTITPERALELFQGLDLELEQQDEDGCTLRIPSFRDDLQREVDLVEEIARMNGLDQIPSPAPTGRIVPEADDSEVRAFHTLQRRLVGLGLRQTMNYSLVTGEQLAPFDGLLPENRIALPNPISAEQAVLRTSLLPQMLESLGRNRSRQIQTAALFETGRMYRVEQGERREQEVLSVGLMGPVNRSPFDLRTELNDEEMFLTAKGLLEQLFVAQGVDDVHFEPADLCWCEPGTGAHIRIDQETAGEIGLVNEALRHSWRLSEPVPMAQVATDVLLKNSHVTPAYQLIPAYPPVARDVALVVPTGVHHAEILAAIRTAAPKELEKVEIFDRFTNESIGADKKSLAYSLSYRASDRSLTDEEANAFHERVKKALVEELGAELR